MLSSATESPHEIPLSYTGVQGELSISPVSGLDFQAVAVGRTKTLRISLENTGTAPVLISAMAVEGGAAGAFGIAGDQSGD